MQIHHREQHFEERWTLDPNHGAVKQRVEIMKPSTMEKISAPPGAYKSCPAGEVFEVQPDGCFHVPDDVAKQFLGMPGWHAGRSPFPPADLVPPTPAKVTVASDVKAPVIPKA